MAEPLFLTWLSILLGVFSMAWPDSFILWFCVSLLFWIGRFHKKIIFGALLLGLLRGAFVFHFVQPPINADQAPHHFKVKVVEAGELGVKAQIESLDDRVMKKNSLARLSGNFLVGQELEGIGQLLPLQSYEP